MLARTINHWFCVINLADGRTGSTVQKIKDYTLPLLTNFDSNKEIWQLQAKVVRVLSSSAWLYVLEVAICLAWVLSLLGSDNSS